MSAGASVLAPEGELTMATAGPLLSEGQRRLAAGDLTVDFSAVSNVDSAALALILGWLRSARGAGTRLTLRKLPAGVASLAALYDLEALLPVESHA